MSIQIWFLAVATLSAALLGGCNSMAEHDAHARGSKNDEQVIELASAPAPVQDAVRHFLGRNKLEKIVREDEHGTTVYEAEYDDAADLDHTITVSASGEVIEEETEIKAEQVPAAVMSAVKATYPDGKFDEAVSVKKGAQSYYEVVIKVGGTKHELKVSADGTVMGDKAKKEEHEADEKDEKNEKGKD